MPIGHLHVFFGEMSIQVFCTFCNRVVWDFFMLNCMSCLYILDINPLWFISFANIFSHSVGYLFTVNGFPYCAKPFKFNYVLFIFAFISFALGD